MNIVQHSDPTRQLELQESTRPWSLPSSSESWLGFSQHNEADAVIYQLPVPGYRRRDLSIEARDRVLIVRGEHTDGLLRPRSKRAFIRSFKLPETLDERDVRAAFNAGVLRLIIGKKPHARRRRIPIGTPDAAHHPAHDRATNGDGTEPWSRLLSWFSNHVPWRTGAASAPSDAT
jgi:HSP20 family molecular chaperone IbpA